MDAPFAAGARPVFVFLGPSLPAAEVRARWPAGAPPPTLLPPVSMGDVYRLTERRPAAIAIVDGLFEQTPAVWHKEILFALSRGIRVLGASSMGALRAAELHRFGMEGIGAVFQAYRDGHINDDDEVAVAHAAADDGFRPLSDAMVSIRAGLGRARDLGLVTAAGHDRLCAHAKGSFYAERSWPALLAAAPELGLSAVEVAALADFVRRERPDVKRADALLLLDHLAAEQARGWERGPGPAPARAFAFEPTYWWEQLVLHEAAATPAEGGTGAATAAARAAALQRHVRLGGAGGERVLETALLLALLDAEAERRGLAPVENLERVAPEAGALAPEERARLARAEAARRELAHLMRGAIDRWLPAALAVRGGLGPALAVVARKQRALVRRGLAAATLEDAGVDRGALLSWYRERHRTEVDPDSDAHALGFTSAEELWSELVAEYLAEELDRTR
jgi:hypothetical protein